MPFTPDAERFPAHGGDLWLATARYGEPAGGWLDLSTGINPHPYPVPPIPQNILTRLPDRLAFEGLLALARAVYRVPSGAGLVAVPGSEAAIRLLPLVLPAGDVAIVGPTYGSHQAAWQNAGRTTVEVQELAEADAPTVVVGNPNNPDGRTDRPERLTEFARRLEKRGGILIVDEAFADVAPDLSLMPHLAGLPALVLRSFGKFYGLAGLRLGFVAGPKAITDRLAAIAGDWPVSGPAIHVASDAMNDGSWSAGMRATLAAGIGAAARSALPQSSDDQRRDRPVRPDRRC